jgi:hypothetical protein
VNQLLLALRSLFIGVAVFLLLAAITAWSFGGALFGKDPVVAFQSVPVGGSHVYLTVKGSKEGPAPVAYALMQRGPGEDAEAQPVVPLVDGRPAITGMWRKVIGPVLGSDGTLRVAVGADRGGSALDWWLVEMKPGEKATARTIPSPDSVVETALEK